MRFHHNLVVSSLVEGTRSIVILPHFLQFFNGGHFFEVFNAEMVEEFVGGAVQAGSSGDIRDADGFDEVSLLELSEGVGDADPADGLDIGSCNRSTIGNDGEGFEDCLGELGRFLDVQQATDEGRILG